MKIALIGRGATGTLVESAAKERGHEIVAVIRGDDAAADPSAIAKKVGTADAAIDFSVASAVLRNVEACAEGRVPLVVGTTGWHDHLDDVRSIVQKSDGAVIYGANFSIGVSLFFRLVERAAELISKFDEYEAFIEEQHHSQKKDAPSGTALKLKQIVSRFADRQVSIASTRAGGIPGTHRVGFDGGPDQIVLEHSARSREGFAQGALLAAEWIVDKKGFFEFSEVVDQILSER